MHRILCLPILLCSVTALFAAGGPFVTPLSSADIDPAAFTQWVDGAETPLPVTPQQVIWTRETAVSHTGLAYGASKTPGPRYLRVGFTKAISVGTVLARAGGAMSVLKPTAAYPGDLQDATQWIPAQRIAKRAVAIEEVSGEQYALWVLPPNTQTRALRFSHTADLADKEYQGWLGGVYILNTRLANLAPQAQVSTNENTQHAGRLINESNDGTWGAWDNWNEATAQVVSPEHPVRILLTWAQPVSLTGLSALWAGFSEVDVQAYTGPADRHPREAPDEDWKTIKHFGNIENQYPRTLGVNWLDFGQTVTTRALRLQVTKVTRESHPHLNGNTKGGKRVWLGELLAVQALGDDALSTAILPLAAAADDHPPIPIRFTLKEAGVVTLVIDDADGRRVRNLVSETPFPAGENTAWWDGKDDLGRDQEAAHHGIYHVPGQFVIPGAFRVRGLYYQKVDLKYEISVYDGESNPPWSTADNTGGWLTNHTPPSSALYVPGEKAPGGKPLVYLGSYVAEGGHGLAWVDLDGKKVGGRHWIGGTWTGAPYLARDAGAKADPDAYVYVGSAFDQELRLTALTAKNDRSLVKYAFANKADTAISGLAVQDGLLACSLPRLNKLLFVDAKAGNILCSLALTDPRGLAFDAQGRLLALAGTRLLRYTLPAVTAEMVLPEPQVLVATGLEDPQHVTLDDKGNFYISDRGTSHQVKVFSPEGALLRAIGHAGVPVAGPYDPLRMQQPNGVTIDANQHLWVAETDFQPKRVSVWTLDGQLVKAFYGPAEYGGGGTLDPQDPTRFYYHGMYFTLNWDTGKEQLTTVFYRPKPEELQLPDRQGFPETPLYFHGQRYFTNCYTSSPVGGTGLTFLWLERNGLAVPVAALGRANDWPLLKTDAFKARWPQGVDPHGDYWRNQALFTWSDLNGDGNPQPDEVTIIKAGGGGVTVMPDLSMLVSRVDGKAMRYAPEQFTAQDVPVYNLEKGEALATDVHGPLSSGGDQALAFPSGWTVLTLGVKPFAPASLCGLYHGAPRWSYPSLWPGLHASHESPPPEMPGELIGTTRLLGGYLAPHAEKDIPLWAVNSNQGNMYLFTEDGLFVATLFRDIRAGISWSMPVAQRGMLMDDVSLHDENFWPSITRTADGRVFMVDGGRTSLVRVDGLDTLARLPDRDITISKDDLEAAQAYDLRHEAQRQQTQGLESLTAPILATAPVVDGKLDDWALAHWVTVDQRGVAAYFNSNTKPYDVVAAVAVTADRLYAAFRTGDANLLHNAGDVANAPFKTGGALDLMIGADPEAKATRTAPAAGDVRLLVTQVKGKTLALLYRAVVPGTKTPVPFSSPWRTITLDQVEDISALVSLAGDNGNFELSVPLATLGLKPAPGQLIKGDIGLLRGDGFQTLHRVYWSNKATGITADVPSEAMLTPQLWGKWLFTAEK